MNADLEQYTVLIVDDDPFILESVSLLLKEYGYEVYSSSNAENALTIIRENSVDSVLTDVRMPGTSGMDLLEKIRNFNSGIPVILFTAYADLDIALDAIKKGAYDFITKPYKKDYMLHAVDKAVKYGRLLEVEKNYKYKLKETVKKRTEELSSALKMLKNVSGEIMQRLTSVAEFRDTETGADISRMGLYSSKIAEALNMPKDFVETITFASPMHDIWKVGIPDNILLKPGALTQDEFAVMKNHTSIGKKMLSGSQYPSIKLAESIALHHHERWDGSGYPQELKRTDIPVEEGSLCSLISMMPSEAPVLTESLSTMKKSSGS